MPVRLSPSLLAPTLVLILLTATAGAAAGAGATLKFGMDRKSVQAQVDLGIRPDYGQFWAGAWNERAGWSGFTGWADGLADLGVTPVVEWWYWGDDINRACVTDGCPSQLHDVTKTRAKWRAGAEKLADALHAGLQGRPGIVVIESEFNKGDMGTWEIFDGYLADHARIFRSRAPELQLVLGFGNWASDNWGTFDRAASAMDMVGFQTMRGSTRDSSAKYLDAVDAIQAATARLRATFGKPVILHDLALSSYPHPAWASHQETVVQELFQRSGELKAAGLQGIIWRTMADQPTMDLANYYGIAERHWGLQRSDGSGKPALDDWVRGVKAERSRPA